MKFTKTLLPVALAMFIASSAAHASLPSAALTDQGSSSANQTLKLTVPTYTDIRNGAGGNLQANAKFTNDYNNLTLDDTLTVNFDVTTNTPDKEITLTAEAGGSAKALYKADDDNNFRLAFVKVGESADASDLEAALEATTSVKTDNPNIIVFTVATTIKEDAVAKNNTPATGTSSLVADNTDSNVIHYTLQNAKYWFNYIINPSACDNNTFSTRDTNGTYQVKLTMQEMGA